MRALHTTSVDQRLFQELSYDCRDCHGLCCSAFYFAKVDGFPYDKAEKRRCMHLAKDHRCQIHDSLHTSGCHGCMTYDCLGAGPAAVSLYTADDLLQEDSMQELYEVFPVMTQLHQMLAYILEAEMVTQEHRLHHQLEDAYTKIQQIKQSKTALMTPATLQRCYGIVNPLLKQVWKQVQLMYRSDHKKPGKSLAHQHLIGIDFSMQCLIQADLTGSVLDGCCFLGTDTRDCKVHHADLRNTLFLTQMQVNQMKGNAKTILPPPIRKPSHW